MQNALEKIASTILKNNQTLNLNKIKSDIAKNINVVIFTKLSNNKRVISNISQIALDENNNFKFEDIFYLNNINQHQSNDIMPEFLKETELISSCININIFDKQYTHTYSKIINNDEEQNSTSRLEMLKKLKKDYSQNQDEEVAKKAHEKFNMLRKNIQSTNQEEIAFKQDDNTQNL